MRILFQGDSVTDASRNREDPADLGMGYAKMASEMLRAEYPDTEFEFFNRGIGGNRAADLAARWDTDAIEIKPDVISILVGINDTWHTVNKNASHEVFEENYRAILERIKKATSAKIIIMEQFTLPHPNSEQYHPDVDIKLQITRKLAREFADAFVPVDGLLAKACVGADLDTLTGDGVHPKQAGHTVIAKGYVEAFKELDLIK